MISLKHDMGLKNVPNKNWLLICFITCLPLASAVREQKTWCYSDTDSKSISCDDSGFMIEIVRAFAGKSWNTDSNFCTHPISRNRDCKIAENGQTDLLRGKCNGISDCNFDLTDKPSSTDCDDYTGSMYIHIEYECHPLTNGMQQEYPILYPCSVAVEETESDVVRLRSVGYPSTWQRSDQCHCSVRMVYDGQANIHIRDMAHDDVNNDACPFFVNINTEKVCAYRGKVYDGVDVTATDADIANRYKDIPLTFYSDNAIVKGRFWIDIRIIGTHSTAVVHCGRFGVDQGMASTTLLPTTTPTTTLAPTTPTTKLSTTYTSSTTVPTPPSPSDPPDRNKNGRNDTEKPTMHTDDLDHNVTSSTPDSTPYATPTLIAGIQTTFKTSTTPSTETMEKSLDLKIIVGGGAAGGVLVILIIVFLAVCLNKNSSSKKKKKGNDLGYSVHANVAIAHSRANSRRQSGRSEIIRDSRKNTLGGSSVPPHYSGTLDREEIEQIKQMKPNLPGHSYVNVQVQKTPVLKHKHKNQQKNQRKSASQVTLHFSSNESLNTADQSNNIFAGFPRWSEEELKRRRGEHTYTNLPPGTSSTLPAKLNKRPMPLPKPERHKSVVNLDRQGPGRYSSNFNRPSGSMASLGQSDFGTGKSTEPLYGRPNKNKGAKNRDSTITILENDMYG